MSFGTGPERKVEAIALALLLLATAVSVVPLAGATDHENPPPSDQTFDATDSGNITVWNRSMLPLRADRSAAQMNVPNALWSTQDPSGQSEAPANRDPVGVYSRNEDIPLRFNLQSTYAQASEVNASDFDGANVTLVRAYISQDAEGTVPTTFDDGVSFLLDNPVGVNYTIADRSRLPSDVSSGTDWSYTDTPAESGHYIYFLATNETGKAGFNTTSDGNLTVEGSTSIIGIENAIVQERSSSYSPAQSSYTAGNTITFSGNSPDTWAGDGSVNHTVVVYDSSTFEGAQFTVNLTDSIAEANDWSFQNNSTLETSISGVNGQMSVQSGHTVLGEAIRDGEASRAASLAANIDFMAESLDGSLPANTASTGNTVLAASVTAVEGQHDGDVTVGTNQGWGAGTYRYVHIAEGSNSTQISTNTGTVQIEAAEPSQGGGGGGGGGGAPGDGDQEDDSMRVTSASLSESTIEPGDSVTVEAVVRNDRQSSASFTATLYVDDEQVDSRTITVPGQSNETVSFTRTFDEEGQYVIDVNDVTAGTLTVGTPTTTASPTTTAGTTEPPGTTDRPDPGETTEPPGDGGGGIPLWGWGIIVIVLLAAVGGVAYYFLQLQP